MAWYVAPIGTLTLSCDAVAELTMAFVTPKKTVFSAAVVLKLVPVMVTIVPTGPLEGENAVMTGML